MRAPLAVVAAAATAAAVVIAVPGGAGAVTLPVPSLSPLPSISLGLPTISTSPLLLPTRSLPVDPGDTVCDLTDPVTGGSDGSGGDEEAGAGTAGTATGTTESGSGSGMTAHDGQPCDAAEGAADQAPAAGRGRHPGGGRHGCSARPRRRRAQPGDVGCRPGLPRRRPGSRRHHLALRHALPPDPALPEAAHRDRLRRGR